MISDWFAQLAVHLLLDAVAISVPMAFQKEKESSMNHMIARPKYLFCSSCGTFLGVGASVEHAGLVISDICCARSMHIAYSSSKSVQYLVQGSMST